MVYNNNIFTNMELPLKTQLAILKLTKKEYKTIVENTKKYVPHTKTKFTERGLYIGLCSILSKSLSTHLGEHHITYTDIKYYIPVFNIDEILRLRELHNNKLKIPNRENSYWYNIDEYQNRINLLNLLINHLQLIIKENRK